MLISILGRYLVSSSSATAAAAEAASTVSDFFKYLSGLAEEGAQVDRASPSDGEGSTARMPASRRLGIGRLPALRSRAGRSRMMA